jgi:hypothetical protein
MCGEGCIKFQDCSRLFSALQASKQSENWGIKCANGAFFPGFFSEEQAREYAEMYNFDESGYHIVRLKDF